MRAILFSVLALTAAATQAVTELDGYSFDKHIETFNLALVKGTSDYESTKLVFDAELARVKTHNAKNLSWKEGMNKFSTMTAAQKKVFHGRSKGVAKHHVATKLTTPSFPMKPVSQLPASVDWRTTGIVSPVKDQGGCGSCWAFASTAVVESHVAKNTGLLFDLSVQQTAMCAPNPNECGGTGGCQGATSELAFDYLANSKGIYEEYQYGYGAYYGKNADCALPAGNPVAHIDGYVQLPANNYTALMNAIATVGPIAISVDAGWSGYTSGIYNGCNQVNPDIDHAVVLVGYGVDAGQKYWLVRNSWSPAWGEKGYIRLARFDNEDEMCGSDITPHDGTACIGEDQPVKVCGTCGVLFDSAYPTGAR